MFRRYHISHLAGWLLAILLVLCASPAWAQWGDLKMQFKVAGKPPALKPLAGMGKMGCPPMIANESFVTDKEGHVKNVVVWLLPEENEKLAVHPMYAKDAAAKIVLDNKGCRFEPHVALVRAGQSLAITNGDGAGHNSRYSFPANDLHENPLIPPKGGHVVDGFKKSEKRAQSVDCAIHPWMQAWVLVQDHPYMAASDAAGDLVIKNLPVGKHKFRAWQEASGHIAPKGSKTVFQKGVFEVEVAVGLNDLGLFEIPPPKD